MSVALAPDMNACDLGHNVRYLGLSPERAVDARNYSYLPHSAAALAGLAVCQTISVATGSAEAWDSAIYFSTGIPVMCAISFVLSYVVPERVWRWTLWMAAGQSVAMLASGNSLSLWPISLVVMTIFSMPQLAAGFAGSRLAGRRRRL